MPTISRQLASAGIADPGNLKSPSLPGASPGLPTGVWFTGNSRPVRFKTEQPWECKSPHADQFGMSTGRARRASVLTSACLRASGASPRHSAISACSSKRTVRLINGIALDQCRVRERYPARRPFLHLRARVARKAPLCGNQAGNRDRPEVFARVAQLAEARRRERRQCQCESDHEHQFMESKPQQTGIRFLPGYGEVATTSGSTNFVASWCNRSIPGFDPDGPGANPGEAANFGRSSFGPPGGEIASRLAYTQKSRGQNLLGRPLPRCIISSAPVSETGSPGAIPGEAANLLRRFYTPIWK